MASDQRTRWRDTVGRLTSAATLLGAGALLVLALQEGWWATLFGAAMLVSFIVLSAERSSLKGTVQELPYPEIPLGNRPLALQSLLDQVPVPLIRTDEVGARAINRAARALFGTDDRIIPPPPALLGNSHGRLRHEGRSWRIDDVQTTTGERLMALIDVDAEESAAEGRAADEMIEILGHELLNGLSPIVSLADSALTAAARGDNALPAILSTLARRVEGLESFTRAYRDLSRLPPPVIQQVHMDEMVDDLARLFASRFRQAVTLSIDGASGQTIRVDRDQITQAVWALLQNGAEAALDGSTPRQVRFTLSTMPRLAVRVADSGVGVAPPNRSQVFRPFFTTKPRGSGIGLSLARRIARAHGGNLRLLPITPTTFELTLPAHTTI